MKNFLRLRWSAVLFIILSIVVTIVSSRRPLYDGYYKARFGDMVQGTAYQPYVNRCFVPFLIRSGKALLPGIVEEKVSGLLEKYPFVAAAGPGDSFKTERAIYLGINIFALIIFGYGIRRLMLFAGLSERWSYLSAVVVLGFIPVISTMATYIYDASALALFTWSLVFLGEKKWYLFIVTFALCVWNKETGILLVWIFLLMNWKYLLPGDRSVMMLHKKYRALMGLQILLVGLILGTIRLTFSSNHGGATEWHFFDQANTLRDFTFGTYIVFLAFVFFISYRYTEQRPLLRAGISILPILIILTYFFGRIDEYRDYYEALPIAATMISVSVNRLRAHLVLLRSGKHLGEMQSVSNLHAQ